MSRERIPPHSLQAEESLLGAMLLSKHALEIAEAVRVEDFYSQSNAKVFAAAMTLHSAGRPVDPVSVSDELARTGELIEIGGYGRMGALQAGVPSAQNAAHYARLVGEAASLRRLIVVGQSMIERAFGGPADVGALADDAQMEIAEAAVGVLGGPPEGLISADELETLESTAVRDWAIPGIMRRDSRLILTGLEGSGKMVTMRMMALCAAQGVQPFSLEPMKQTRTLIVDLENPDEAILETSMQCSRFLRGKVRDSYNENGCVVFRRPEGLDLRSRTGRADLEAALAEVQPTLVCLGPLYKAFDKKPGEDDEQSAKGILKVFDQLRVKYDFALVVEHHVAKASGGGLRIRDLVPIGSSVLMRWPELGKGLMPNEDGSVEVEDWRPPRIRVQWPVRLDRAHEYHLPWHARYPANVDTRGYA